MKKANKATIKMAWITCPACRYRFTVIPPADGCPKCGVTFVHYEHITEALQAYEKEHRPLELKRAVDMINKLIGPDIQVQIVKALKAPKIKMSITERGFAYKDFSDHYGQLCSIQKSSLATKDCIRLGVDNSGPRLGNASIKGQMHLTRSMVKKLLPLLQLFADTGELDQNLVGKEGKCKK